MPPHEFITWKILGSDKVYEQGSGRDNLNRELSAAITKELKAGHHAIIMVVIDKKVVRK